MLINLTELFSLEGKEKDYRLQLEMEAYRAPDGVYEITRKEPVLLHIRNTGGRKLSVEGSAELSLAIPCSRCLDPVEVPFKPFISF